MKRRDFIKLAALGSAAALGDFVFPGILKGKSARTEINPNFKPDVELELRAMQDRIQIFSGPSTKVWRYWVKPLKGPENAVKNLSDTYLGPILRLGRGQKVRVIFHNDIPDKTIVHWHGLHVPEKDDGHPRFVINKGEKYVYEFEINNRAGTYWFHPHPHGKTGPQVYYGLAGLFIISDEEEKNLNLPSGKYDIPIVIQDRSFDSKNQLVYLTNRMQKMWGFLGDQIMVNGRPNYTLELGTAIYRLRLLNGSNSRIYKLAWSDGTPLTVIATDGGLLEKPVTKNYLMLGPAERVELWLDLSGRKVGDELVLKSLQFEGAGMGMMGGRGGMMGGGMMGGRRGGMMGNRGGMGGGRGGMMGGAMGGGMVGSFSGETEFEIMRIKITHKDESKYTLPRSLSTIKFYKPEDAINYRNPRTFVFAMMHMQPTINGRTFQMTKVTPDEVVKLNTTEMWKFVNSRTGMQMPHPVHVHDVQFQIVERTPSDIGWDSIKDGFVDNGWKDTVLLMPGMEAKVIMSFKDYTGLYLYHCHNLEHEDMGMMRNFLIKG